MTTKIYIHGNCQAPAMAQLLAEADPTLRIMANEVHAIDLATGIEAYMAAVKTADIIISQPVSRGYRGDDRLSTDWLRENARPGATLLIMPVLYFRGYHPQSFSIQSLQRDLKMPYVDVHFLEMYCRGMSTDEIYREITRAHFFSPAFLRSELLLSLQETVERDRLHQTSATVADLILSEFQNIILFQTFNHPGRYLLAHLANRLLRLTGSAATVPIDGAPCLARPVTEIYLSTVEGLQLRIPTMARVETVADAMSDRPLLSYLEQVARNLDASDHRETLLSRLMEDQRAAGYLARFKAAHHGASTGIDPMELVRSLYKTVLRREASLGEVSGKVRFLREEGVANAVESFLVSAEYARLLQDAEDGPQLTVGK